MDFKKPALAGDSSSQPEEQIARPRIDGDAAIVVVRGHGITARHPAATLEVVVLLQGGVVRGQPAECEYFKYSFQSFLSSGSICHCF